MTMAAIEKEPSQRRRALRGVAALIGLSVILALLTAIARSSLPMRGAELFGALANKIKGNPGATTVVVLSAGALLWVGIGALAAIQEWLATRRRTP